MKKILFDHIPKNAGTSLNEVLKLNLGASSVAVGLIESHQAALMQFADKLAISGHLWFRPSEHLSPHHSYITILRHPIDRALSLFFFYKKVNGVRSREVNLAKHKSLYDYIFSTDSSIIYGFQNYQTVHYMQLEYDGRSNLSETDKLELAKRGLERYTLVGSYDYFNDFVDILCYDYCWPAVAEIPRLNVNNNRAKISEIPAEIIHRLEELNQADIALYEYATELFLKRKRKVMTGLLDKRNNAFSFQEAETSISYPPLLIEINNEPLISYDFGNHQLEIISVTITGEISNSSNLYSGENATIKVVFHANKNTDCLTIGIQIRDPSGKVVFGINNEHLGYRFMVACGGMYFIEYTFRNDLGLGSYSITAALHTGSSHPNECYHWQDNATDFEVTSNIGYYFEGAIKLYPTLDYGLIKGSEESIEVLEFNSVNFDESAPQKLTISRIPLTEFAANIQIISKIEKLHTSEVIAAEVKITNTSTQSWRAKGQLPVHFSYHWRDLNGNLLEYNGLRTALSRDILPNESIRMMVNIKTVSKVGNAILQLTLVQENVAWFEDRGMKPLELMVNLVQ